MNDLQSKTERIILIELCNFTHGYIEVTSLLLVDSVTCQIRYSCAILETVVLALKS